MQLYAFSSFVLNTYTNRYFVFCQDVIRLAAYTVIGEIF